MKRGQITLFIILGVVIVSVVVLGFFFREQIAKTATIEEAAGVSALPPDLESLRDEISECASIISEEAAYTIGQQGGYFLTPDDAIMVGEYSVAYGVSSNAKILASEDILKTEIASYIEAFLPECVNYPAYGTFEIFDQLPSTSINFNEEDTQLSIDYKVTAQKDGNAYNILEPYEVELPYRVKKVYESSSKIADEIALSPENFDAGKILSYGLDVEINNLGNNVMVVTVTDRNGEENNYEFQFGVAL